MRFSFHVYGCRLNQAEAATWRSALEAKGWQAVRVEEAEILFVHSCAVTEPAVHEIEKMLRAHRQKFPHVKVVVSGCAATLLPSALCDLQLPHEQKAQWVQAVLAFAATPSDVTSCGTAARYRTRASLIIQDGCDQFCSYCIVPYMRGAPVSEPMSALIAKVDRLFEEGYQEIVLTGCHLALYRDPETGADFLTLLQKLCERPGKGRFRMSSLEPGILDDRALVQWIAAAGGRVCHYLHLPLQTGSDALLKAMGRRYTSRDIRQLLETIATTLPYAGLGADWIVGLPGETEADAAATCQLVAEYPFTGAHIFPYSRRPGTPAATFPNQVPQHLQYARVQALTACANAQREALMPRYLGRTLEVIPEQQKGAYWEGWSAERLRCKITPPARRGELHAFVPTVYHSGAFYAEAPE